MKHPDMQARYTAAELDARRAEDAQHREHDAFRILALLNDIEAARRAGDQPLLREHAAEAVLSWFIANAAVEDNPDCGLQATTKSWQRLHALATGEPPLRGSWVEELTELWGRNSDLAIPMWVRAGADLETARAWHREWGMPDLPLP